ncbi:MAG: putative acetyltransferase [Pirellulaceae bacterium]|jgi:predicted acetyltransferase
MAMKVRQAVLEDASELARLNQQLICDEGHRNVMTLDQLQQRMVTWLSEEYVGYLFGEDDETVGYALSRSEDQHVYLRQFFVVESFRRQGIGRAAFEQLRAHWGTDRRVRLDVLSGNQHGIAFWRAVGFAEYCITMECD